MYNIHMENNNETTQYKIIAGISLLTGGAVAGNLLRGYLEFSSLEIPLVLLAACLMILGAYMLKKV